MEVRCNFRTDGEMGENVKVGGREGAVAPDKVGEGTTDRKLEKEANMLPNMPIPTSPK